MAGRFFDLVVIGSGSAGHSVAMACRKRGWSVAIVDERPFGGTCALRGCDPKKVLVHAASVVDAAQRLRDISVVDRAPALEWSQVMRFKRTFTNPVPAQRRKAYEEAGIVAIAGRAAFSDERTLRIDGELLRAEHIVVATGAKTKHVVEGDDLLLDSEAFLEVEDLPKSLIFVGGGFIAFEFAHVAKRAGAEVTIVHQDDKPLQEFDQSVVARLLDHTRNIGVGLELESTVKTVSREGNGIACGCERGGRFFTLRAQAGVLASGREPDITDLGLDRANVKYGERGIAVDEHMQSVSNSRVYAAGDAADCGLRLTPVASYGAEVVTANLLDGKKRTVDFRGLASIVYTIPPLGQVGLNEASAKELGLPYELHEGDMRDWYSTRLVAGQVAYYKTLIEKSTGKIAGAAILGPHAEEQINVLALAIRAEIDASRVRDSLFAYPTGSSDLEYMIG